MKTGTIIRLARNNGDFGFIRQDDGSPDCFLHRNQLEAGLTWGPHLQELRVQFETEQHPKGPRAQNVRAIS